MILLLLISRTFFYHLGIQKVFYTKYSSYSCYFDTFHQNLTKLKNSRGLNPTSISELSGIPRATVIRKIKYLVDKNFLYKDNQLYKINNKQNSKSFKLQNKNFKKNQEELRNFLKEILNLIKN